MRSLARIAALLLLAYVSSGHGRPAEPAWRVTIVGDTNRDGTVDVAGDSDLADKQTWTRDRGALFLANIVDTDRRCSAQITSTTADEDLDKCHDASDNVLRNPGYLARLRTRPIEALGEAATGRVHVTNTAAAAQVRIFHQTEGQWVYVGAGYRFPAAELRAGLELGIDARDVRRPDGWDGRATVQFVVREGAAEARDEVALRVAPVLTHHHGQLAQLLLTQSSNMSGRSPSTGQKLPVNRPYGADGFRHDAAQAQFIANLGRSSGESGMESAVFLLDDPQSQTDIWVQDYFEPGYMSIPGPEGPVGLRIMVRSAQDWRTSGRLPFQYLRSNTTGAIQHLADGGRTDSMGNLETIPPFTHNGVSYPAGRTILGSQYGKQPYIVDLLRAQEEQDPIMIDTSWLYVGHTDEFLQFLPADNDDGWVMMVSDPMAGLALLQAAQRAGYGSSPAVSRPRFLAGRPACVPSHTVDEVLGTANFDEFQHFSAEVIEKNIGIIKQATGVSDERVIRVPGLFYDDTKPFADDPSCKLDLDDEVVDRWRPYGENQTTPGEVDAGASYDVGRLDARQTSTPPRLRTLERRQASASASAPDQVSSLNQVSSLYPGSVNGVVVGGRRVITPRPWGPVVNGQDVLATAVRNAYSSVNFSVVFIDDWFSHHLGTGEVHCGSNTLRDMSRPWW